jgi:hypothetical protein
MAVLGGLKPSQLDPATVTALQTVLQGDSIVEMLYGQGIINIRRKLSTMIAHGKPASSIKITLFADSIWASSSMKQDLIDYFNDIWGIPEANIDTSCCWGAYETWAYIPCLESAVISPNVDLFILSEVSSYELLDQMIAYVRSKTNTDIMLGSWSMSESSGFPRYSYLIDFAKKYNCEIFDINGLLLRKYLDGTYLTYMNAPNDVHLSTTGAEYIFNDFKKHFQSTRYYNEFVNPESVREETIYLGAEKMLPVFGVIFTGGTWSAQGNWESLTMGSSVRSSVSGNTIEFTFTGIGFEILFGNSASENIHEVLIDDVAPSTLGLEYCTQIVGKTQTNSIWWFHRFFGAYVTIPFMTNDEESVEFEITVDSIARNGSNILTGLTYTLKQDVTTLGTGNINTDSTFVFRSTGEITIPALIHDIPNYVEIPGYPFTVGDTMSFFAKKTWKDSINSDTETLLKISGLNRTEHRVKITKTSNVASDLIYLSMYK